MAKSNITEGGRPEWKEGDDPEAPIRANATPEEKKRQLAAYRKHQKSGKPPWSKTKTNSESTQISMFLKSLTEKNYAEANKYLHAVLDTKMKGKIKTTATK